jgi:NADH-quinone oxidoreductase subunit L
MTPISILTNILHFLIFLPLAGFVINILLPRKNENLISGTTIFTIGLHFIVFSAFTVYWLINGHPTLNLKDVVLFQSD